MAIDRAGKTVVAARARKAMAVARTSRSPSHRFFTFVTNMHDPYRNN